MQIAMQFLIQLTVVAALGFQFLLHASEAAPRQLPGVGAAMREMIAANEIAGAVTVVVTKDETLHLECTGYADRETRKPVTAESLFGIASMTKPITGVAVMVLQDERRLKVSDLVAKYIPEFAQLKTSAGEYANLTIVQILTHTSGLGEAKGEAARDARSLRELVPLWLAAPMQYNPGEKWKYTQSGLNLAARIVEVVSGMSFDAFLQKRVFDPLGMKDTTYYPTDEQRTRMVSLYAKNRESGTLERRPHPPSFGTRLHPPQGNGSLFSTARDYALFCQMLLNRGTLDGTRIISEAAFTQLTSVHTGDLPTGFLQAETYGQRGANYGWGLGVSVLRRPHDGVAAMLSPGTYGHGGSWGTAAWIDPVKGVAYLLLVQRANFPNFEASEVRRTFQQAAADALNRKR